MEFVPADLRDEQVPCRFVRLGNGLSVDALYRCGTSAEMEGVLTGWLERRIHEIEFELRIAAHSTYLLTTGTEN